MNHIFDKKLVCNRASNDISKNTKNVFFVGSFKILVLAWGMCLSSLVCAHSLLEIYELSLKNDPLMKSAEATYNADLLSDRLSRAGLLPKVQADYSYLNSRGDTFQKLNDDSSFDSRLDTEANNWSIKLRQPIYDLPAWFTFKQGAALSKLASERFAVYQQDHIIKIESAYFDVLRSIDNIESAKLAENDFRQTFLQAAEKLKVGLIAPNDVAEAQAQYDASVTQKLSALVTLEAKLQALESLAGKRVESVFPLKADLPILPLALASEEEWVAYALKNNGDIKVAEMNRSALHNSARAKDAEKYPKVNFSLGYSNDDTQGAFSGFSDARTKENATRFGFDFYVPLYTGGSNSTSAKQSKYQAIAADEDYQATKLNVIEKTKSLVFQVKIDVATVGSTKLALNSARKALRATRAGYDVGTRNMLEVIQALSAFHKRQLEYSNSRFDYLEHKTQLKKTTGTLTPADLHEVNLWLDQGSLLQRGKFRDY